MRIRFTADARIDRADGSIKAEYHEGQVVELRDDIAKRWIRRNKAIRIEDGGTVVINTTPKPAPRPEPEPETAVTEPVQAPETEDKPSPRPQSRASRPRRTRG